MSDLHSINEAINKRAGRKLLASIFVSLLLLIAIFTSIAYVPILFALLVCTAVLLALRELISAFHARGIEVRFLYLSLATSALIASSWFGGLPGLAISVVVSMITLLFIQLMKGVEGFIKNSTASLFALLYPGFVSGFIFLLARAENGFDYITTLVIVVGCNDTFAYLAGIAFGKHPLAPKISPKKSWEGFIGGLLFTTIGSSLAFYYLLDRHPYIGALAGFLGVLAATVGDLVESALKRDLSIKDMGTLLPGHGGMLDRIDSVLITAPVLWCFIELIKHFS